MRRTVVFALKWAILVKFKVPSLENSRILISIFILNPFPVVMLTLNHIRASLSSYSVSGNFLLRFCSFPWTESDSNTFWSLNVFNATSSYLKVNFYCIGVGVEKLVTQPISERTIYQLALERNQHRLIKTKFRWVSHVCNWWTTKIHLHKWPIECHLVHLRMIRFLEVSFHKFGLHRYLVRFQKMCLWDSKAAADFEPIIPVVHNLRVKNSVDRMIWGEGLTNRSHFEPFCSALI